jgi:hypothetical protein
MENRSRAARTDHPWHTRAHREPGPIVGGFAASFDPGRVWRFGVSLVGRAGFVAASLNDASAQTCPSVAALFP